MTSLKGNRIVEKMLDRLFAALVNGPSLNARPHSSRQRIDFTQLGKLKDQPLEEVLKELLGEKREAKVIARVPAPKKRATTRTDQETTPESDLTPEEKAAQQRYSEQQSVVTKMRGIAEDAKSYENDTGVHVLQIGFPLLSLPPGSFGKAGFARRILAPVCFISLSMTVKGGPTPSVSLECRNQGADLVIPNIALLAWLVSQAGKDIGELDADESGERPWDEIAAIVGRVSSMLNLQVPTNFTSGEVAEASLALQPCPRADATEASPQILSSGVIGLFPLANQGLIRDTQAILAGEPVAGPIESFLNVSVSLESSESKPSEAVVTPVAKQTREFHDERLIAQADPCQARAVKLARKTRGLVVHGPPGTGKSQTIANIVGDHLARGQRVLFVCDKRTALDVVMNRLEAMGLGSLCAIVHDPQRDQRDLYRTIREQLDNLTEQRTDSSAETRVARLDGELQQLHGVLTEHHAALMHRPSPQSPSFHELMGQWLSLPSHDAEFKDAMMTGVPPEQIDAHTRDLHELFGRGITSEYAHNRWVAAAGISLADFLAKPMDEMRAMLQSFVEKSTAGDQTIAPNIPPFGASDDVVSSAADRAQLAEQLKQLTVFEPARLHKWVAMPASAIQQNLQRVLEASKQAELIAQGALDDELFPVVRDALPKIALLNQQVFALESYLVAIAGFFGFFAFGKKKAAAHVLAPFGLQLSRDNATRVKDFLFRLKARILVSELLAQLTGGSAGTSLPPDDGLIAGVTNHHELFKTLVNIESNKHLKPLRERLQAAAGDRESLSQMIEGLEKSRARAAAIAELETALRSAGLFSDRWLARVSEHIRENKPIHENIASLHRQLGTLETVLRIRAGLSALPDAIRVATNDLLGKSVDAETGWTILKKASLAMEIGNRLRTDTRLQSCDNQRLQSCFERYMGLDSQKKGATRDAILHLWGSRQKERLVVQTGSRLNGAGADLRRRFTLRGERAMRLRQIISVGQGLPDGDPLFDLRPVWMASPETVAQIFARKSLFDVIVFDEASQCRLEEALPVLLRGERVVIAGDPKQLPPTRFFESAVAVSDEDEITDDQQLFESQQGEIEDLLGAALNIEIEECYLDVHYRSRNSDLIEFSNSHFYSSRLQPIPGHPANRSRFAPLTLYRVDGVYEDRQNVPEADKVCQIIRDLLRRAQPPSIGVACFNITQRDLILDKLDEESESDPEFARALDQAMKRRGKGSFEGLFVKNLENVQGDERDHMIISTTYGPDPSGKFYRRFGPLGRAGGGRRLNVLVTRARDEVHLVTSIPASEYRHLPPVTAGQAPGGPWLLFSYLAYAEQLAELYEQTHRILEQAQTDQQPTLNARPTKYPSEFCKSLGQNLVDAHKTGADVYWGNDGFCVDLALQHPRRIEDVTIGILCDSNRFEQAADPVEWELFRTAVLQSQGWKLHRVWTPHFFRDTRGGINAILEDVQSFLGSETERDAIRVGSGELPQ